MSLKPHLACDLDLTKVVYPIIGMPKIDGVRGMNINHAHQQDHTFHGRSLKQFKNKFVTNRFSGEQFHGLDGELVLGSWTDPRLCSNTTGFVNRKTAKPGKPTESEDLVWYVFDYLAPHVVDLPYGRRLEAAGKLVNFLALPYVRIVPHTLIYSEEQLLAFSIKNLESGFEGDIYRDLEGLHKSGRATVKVGAYLRRKLFTDFEGTITRVEEAEENTNEAKTNELGRTERSSHKANMVPKGMVGNIYMTALKDVEHNDEVVIKKGEEVKLGPGNMDHATRKEVWEAYVNRTADCWVGQIGKGKFFGHGIKDKIRFGTFVSLRSLEDMSDE